MSQLVAFAYKQHCLLFAYTLLEGPHLRVEQGLVIVMLAIVPQYFSGQRDKQAATDSSAGAHLKSPVSAAGTRLQASLSQPSLQLAMTSAFVLSPGGHCPCSVLPH